MTQGAVKTRETPDRDAITYPPPATVAEYSDVIEQFNSGRFLAGARDTVRDFFTCMYGGPFFALATLAPDVLNGRSLNLVFGGETRPLAEDGGRWLSLYSRAIRYPGKLNCIVCSTFKSKLRRAPQSILFQPPQRIVAKEWSRFLAEMDEDPSALFFYPSSSPIDLANTARRLLEIEYRGPILLPFRSRTEAVVFQKLLREQGFYVSSSLNFPLRPGEPQAIVQGAWWIVTRAPAAERRTPSSPQSLELLVAALTGYLTAVEVSAGQEGGSNDALAYGTHCAARVEGKDVQGILLASKRGVDVKSGRLFAEREIDASIGDAEAAEPTYEWTEETLSPLALQTEDRQEPASDESHFRIIATLGRAFLDVASTRGAEGTKNEARADGEAEPRPGRPEAASAPPAPELGAEPSSPTSNSTRPGQDVAHGTARIRSLRSRLSRNAGAINVLAAAVRLGHPQRTPPADLYDKACRTALTWVRNRGYAIPDESGNSHIETPNGEVSVETDGEKVWALRFDDRKQMEGGAFWRVELALIQAQPHPAIGVRLYQVRRTVDAPAPVSGVPKVVATIASELGIHDAGIVLSSHAQVLQGRAGGEALLRMLLNTGRRQPVIVISNHLDVDMKASCDRLAERLVAAAHVVTIDNKAADFLMQHIGRDVSVYGSAIRLYRPGFDEHSDPALNRLWTYKGNHFSPRIADDIAEETLAISVQSEDIEHRVPSFASIRNAVSAATLNRLMKRTEQVASTAEEERARQEALRTQLESELSTAKARIAELEEENGSLVDELELALQERTDALDENRRLRHKLTSLQEFSYREELDNQNSQEVCYPDTWDELETWITQVCEDRVVLLPQAIKAARDSPFRDVPLAYKALELLANHYIPLRTRQEDDDEPKKSFDRALAELGLECTPVGTATSDRRYKKDYRRLHEGREITLDMHLKRGAGFDPASIFRLYFCYDAARSRVIVGHLPTHLTNRKTHAG